MLDLLIYFFPIGIPLVISIVAAGVIFHRRVPSGSPIGRMMAGIFSSLILSVAVYVISSVISLMILASMISSGGSSSGDVAAWGIGIAAAIFFLPASLVGSLVVLLVLYVVKRTRSPSVDSPESISVHD